MFVLLAALSVVVLTRTQSGRDVLRGQIVRTFNNSFEGSLEIGRLQGNLVRELYASNVRLFDPEGDVVVSIDSVSMSPHWRSLFGGAFIAEEVALFRPQINLVLKEDSGWNIAHALASTSTDRGPSNPLDFRAATLRLVDGIVTTTNRGPLPSSVQSGSVFDFTNAILNELNAELELDWRDDVQLFRVESFAGSLNEDRLTIESLSGLVTLANWNLQAENLNLVTSRSQVRGTISLTDAFGDLDRIDTNLRDSYIAAADVTAILPSIPLADVVAVQGHIHGPISSLTVDDIVLSRGNTEILAEGTLNGLPDSLAFNLTTPGSRIRTDDLTAIIPTLVLPLEATRLGLVQLEGDLAGAVHFGHQRSGLHAEVDVAVAADVGRFEGFAEIRTAPGRPLRFSIDGDANDVNPAVILANEEYAGNISGRVFVERNSSEGNSTLFQIGLGPSYFAGRQADSLSADGVWNGRTVEANVAIRQRVSRLNGKLFVDADESHLSFDGALSAFNLNQLLPESPSTRFTGPVSAALSGTSLATLESEIEADFSEAVLEVDGTMQELPTGPFTLLVSPPDQPGPRFLLTTEIIEAELKGGLDLESTLALGERWGRAFAYAATSETNKPLRSQAKSISTSEERGGQFRPPEIFQLDVRVLDPDGLRAFIPGLPFFSAGTDIRLAGIAGTDSIAVDVEATGARLESGPFATGRYDVVARAEGTYSSNVSESVLVNLEAEATNFRIGDRQVRQGRVVAELDQEAISFIVAGNGVFGSKENALQLNGRMELLSDRNRITIDDLAVETAGITWGGDEQLVADLYSDAAVLERMVFSQVDIETDERLEFSGVLSTAPTDSVFVDVYRVDLGRLARLGSIRPLRSEPGGVLNGRLAISNLLRRPEVSGSVGVPRLMLGNRLLGQLDVTSSLSAARDGVEIDLRLSPPDSTKSIERGILLERNDLSIAGNVRFPGRDDAGARDAGSFDLTVDARKADMFFFDLIFPQLLADTRGYAFGDGSISGDFSFPEFSANMSLAYGSTTIPEFGLQFGLTGDVQIDRDGIHLADANLTDKGGGTANIGGSILFNDYRFFSLDLNAALNNVEIIDVPSSSTLPFYGYIRADGTVSVTGPLDNVFLRSRDAVTTEDSEIFIPIRSAGVARDRGFLVFADSLGQIPEQQVRTNLITGKPDSERSFIEGLEMSLNVTAPSGSTVHLVFDEATGDVINAEGSAEMQLAIREGRFQTFGTFTASGGDYLFTAGDVFTRRFEIEPGGRLIWDGDPLEARMDLTADYRTRASLAGLGLPGLESQRVPMVIRTRIGGRLTAPIVDLSINLDADQRTGGGTAAAVEALRPILNNTDQQALYASSVLLTGTFLLAPVENISSAGSGAITSAADELLYTSLSQLVSSRLNLFLSQALASENVEVLLGLTPVDAFQRFDLTYGVALRLLDERLVIRGEGVYQQYENQTSGGELQGEVAVEVRLSNSVSLEVFYRRESELLGGTSVGTTPYGAYGAGISFERDFTSWRSVLRGLLGRNSEATVSG